MIKIEIGAIVDWIDHSVRFRGLVLDMNDSYCYIVVIGSTTIHSQPKSRLVPVRSSNDFIKFSNP